MTKRERELESERDTWALAAKILLLHPCVIMDIDPDHGEHECGEVIAFGYALAEAYGDNWLLSLRGEAVK